MDGVLQAIKDLHEELRVAALESRVRDAELRSAIAELRSVMSDRFDHVRDRLDDLQACQVTLFDELAAFRVEYNAHGHPEG